MKTTMISKISAPDGQSGVGCVKAGGSEQAASPGGETWHAAAGPRCEDEMVCGLVLLWLCGMTFFIAIASLYNGWLYWGYGLLVCAVLGLLRSAKHLAAAQALAKVEEVPSEKCRVRSGEKEEGGGL